MTLNAEARPSGQVTVVVVDDEELARRRIAQLLEREPDMKVVAECRNGREAIETVERLRPDLLFLDVQMPEVDGFGVLAGLSMDPLPEAVFVTAYDEHAIRAFEVNALDYLLKPFDADRFRLALDRARDELRRPRRTGAGPRLAALMASTADGTDGQESASARARYVSRFLVKTGTRTVVVRAGDVDHIEADGNYVRLHVDTRSFLLRETMNRLEQSLDPAAFVRIHRSAIVNIARVREVEPHLGHDYIVRLASGARVRMSRWYHEEFERRMRHGTG
ncbi:MAG: LytR/AlgR family response regulator transcription factor [Gemmatimonadales bacterium]